MDFRGQEKELRPGSLGYSHFTPDLPGGERSRDGNDNGTTLFSHSQTLDHHNQLQQQHLNQQHQSLGQGRVPDPDRVTNTGAVAVATIAPILGRSSLKTPSIASIRYRECLKNHAANIGGNVVDGCGEFMPSGEEGTLEALKCAACECHRNFHRKEVDGETNFRRNMFHPLQLPPPFPSPPLLQHQKFSMGLHSNPSTVIVPPMTVAYGGSGGTESSSEDLNVFQSNVGKVEPPPPFVLSKKRSRTKFTQEQKDRMLEFAEKVGWRIQKQDEEEVQKVCAEVGVKRQVLKVWMHNNKNSMKKLAVTAVANELHSLEFNSPGKVEIDGEKQIGG